ncbi:hypothetical protein Tco_0343489, partial [Tanacetum coccineum]
ISFRKGDVAQMVERSLSMREAQSQACEQSMVEAEKDFKKMIGQMSETHETMEKQEEKGDVAQMVERSLSMREAQNQACEQSMVEAEKDFKKMIDHISETHDTMGASYTDVIAEAQAQAARCIYK